jgi:hypothetical protein
VKAMTSLNAPQRLRSKDESVIENIARG